jgi:hypothetical protein
MGVHCTLRALCAELEHWLCNLRRSADPKQSTYCRAKSRINKAARTTHLPGNNVDLGDLDALCLQRLFTKFATSRSPELYHMNVTDDTQHSST